MACFLKRVMSTSLPCALLAILHIASASSSIAATSETESRVQDDVFSDTYAFDSRLNIVTKKSDIRQNYQTPFVGTHYYANAVDMFGVLEPFMRDHYWTENASAWPLWQRSVIAKAGPSNEETVFSLHTAEDVLPAVSGKHKLWIRWVRWKNLPAPLIVKVKQGDKVVGEARIGTNLDDNLSPFQGVIVWDSIDCDLEAGKPTSIQLIKTPDLRLAGDRIVDSIYLTSNLEYRPVGRSQLPDAKGLADYKSSLGLEKSLVFWPLKTPWGQFGIHDLPQRFQIQDSSSLTACGEEIEQQLVLITSLSKASDTFAINSGPLLDEQGKSFPAPEVRVAAQLKTHGYDWVNLPLFRRNSVSLEPFHTTGLWIKFDTRGVPEGNYKSKLTLQGKDGTTHVLDLNLKVLPVKLPPLSSFWVTVWTEPKEMPAPAGLDIRRLMLRDIAEHRINLFQFGNWGTEYAKDYNELGFVAGWKPTEPWAYFQDKVETWDPKVHSEKLKSMVKEVQDFREAIGFAEKPFIIQFGDEFPINEKWLSLYKEAKAVSGDLLTFSNGYMVSREHVADMKGLIDVWMPTPTRYKDPDLRDAIVNAGAKPLVYIANQYDETNPGRSLYMRKLGWFCVAKGIEGMGFYCYNGYNGNTWADGSGTRYDKSPLQETVVYPGTQGPIPTANWEAWRESAEDVALLYQVRDKINDSALSAEKRDELRALYESALNAAVNAHDMSDFDAGKKSLSEALSNLAQP